MGNRAAVAAVYKASTSKVGKLRGVKPGECGNGFVAGEKVLPARAFAEPFFAAYAQSEPAPAYVGIGLVYKEVAVMVVVCKKIGSYAVAEIAVAYSAGKYPCEPKITVVRLIRHYPLSAGSEPIRCILSVAARVAQLAHDVYYRFFLSMNYRAKGKHQRQKIYVLFY